MSSEQHQLEAGMVALEAQRALLGDAVVDAALGSMLARLQVLRAAAAEAAEPARPAEAAGPAGPAKPASAPEAEQSLRQVSILFLDVVGSTSLAQRLDPEEVSAVMDGALSRGTDIVHAHRGRVLQYAGDNILAAFGSVESSEDDTERAVRCGLALLELGKTLGAEVLAAHGHAGLDVRVGIHTGGVLLGGGVDEDGSIRGQSVNIAARMEQTAPPGGLRISKDTWRQVCGLFEAEPQAPIEVKGLDEPLDTFIVLRERPRAFRNMTRGVEGIDTRMVGRDVELCALQAAWARLQAPGGARHALLVVAEAGMGKSRLLHEFGQWAQAQPTPFIVLQGRADPSTQQQPYGLLRDVLAWQLKIAHDDSEDVAKAKVEAGIAPLFADDGPELAQAHAHLLGHLIGLDYSASPHVRGIVEDPKQIRTRAFHTASQAFRRLALRAGCAMLLQIDDLHWADDGSLDFLVHLLRANRDVPMLLLALARPTLFERHEDWGSADAVQRLTLTPLDEGASRQLAEELLKQLPRVPAMLSDLLTGRADGNPLFMEELVKMLIDQGALQREGAQWVLNPDGLLAAAVPATLTGILQSRLDGLPAPERLALQEASVIGLVFWEPTLAALDPAAPAALPALTRRQLALPRADTSLEGAAEFGFSNQILHDVAYETLLKRTRRDLHARAAAWFAGHTGVRAAGLQAAAAEHYEKAGDTRRAADYFARAALQARRRFAHGAALSHVARALGLLGAAADGPSRELHWRLLDTRERTFELQGRRPEQRADLEALHQLADLLDDDERRADIAVRRALLAGRSGDLRGQESFAREALARAERTDNAALRLNAQRLLADSWARLGGADAGESLARQGLAEARQLGLADPESRFLNALAVIAAQRNDVVEALECTRQATALRRQLGDRRNEAIGLAGQGGSWLELGAFERAREALEEALRLHRAMGDQAMEPIATANLSQLALWEGRPDEACRQAETALAAATDVQATYLQAFALWCLGHARAAAGAFALARQAFEQALVAAGAIGSPVRHDAAAGLACVALAEGDTAAARQALQDVLPALAEGGGLEGTFGAVLVELTAYRVLLAAGDARAPQVLDRAHTSLQARAAALTDDSLRQSFLQRVPPHRELVERWAALQAAAA